MFDPCSKRPERRARSGPPPRATAQKTGTCNNRLGKRHEPATVALRGDTYENARTSISTRDPGVFGAEHRVRTSDLHLGNSEGPHSRTFPALHSQPKPSISFGTMSQPDPRISHAATQKHESLGPTGVQEDLLGVGEVARRLGVCTATIYSLCARGELSHVRVLNAIRVAPSDLASFIARHRR